MATAGCKQARRPLRPTCFPPDPPMSEIFADAPSPRCFLLLDRLCGSWFVLSRPPPETPARVGELTRHPAFSRQNPNRMRALIGAFSRGNPLRVHDPSGAGYALLADEVIAVDPWRRASPETGARILRRQRCVRQARMPRGRSQPASRYSRAATLRDTIGSRDVDSVGEASVDIATWLHGLGMQRYEQAFRDNAIDAAVLTDLTAEDLKDLGVNLVGHRRRLLAAIAALRSEGGPRRRDADEVDPAAERRQITVMFCDVVDSTALSTRLDPEDLREVLGAYRECVAATIGRYEGFVARYMGDGVLAFFGYPQAHEDDAERAVRAGLAQIEATRQLQTPERLEIRIGIATGLVVIEGLPGIGHSEEWDVAGETPNLAARIQTLALPNTVVIDPRTRRLLANLFEYREFGAVQLKGFDNPVHPYEVLRPRVIESRFEALHPAQLTPLVGREEEIELLGRRWAQAKTGSGRVVLISAEPGIGKSRLAEAFRNSIAREQHTRLRYFCSPHHRDSALFPFIGQIERAAGFARDDTLAAKLDKLEALLAPNAPAECDVALLAELLSLPFGDRYPALDFTPQRKKEKTFEALLRQFAGLAERQPVLMIFEDLHWADPTSRELLDLSVELVARMPVLLIATFRPEFEPPWTGQPHVETLPLHRLGREESGELVRGIIGTAAALSSEIVEEIVERTDGVPLFIEELTKAVVETAISGAVVGKTTVSSIPATPPAVPATLHATLMAPRSARVDG
jgi:class 3 adenylate cyclase